MPSNIRIGDNSYEIREFDMGVIPMSAPELPQPQSSSTRATPQPPRAPHLNQAEIDRILASYGRVTTTDERRTTQQPLDFDPNNLTISERVGLNDIGIYRPRYYKRTGDKS